MSAEYATGPIFNKPVEKQNASVTEDNAINNVKKIYEKIRMENGLLKQENNELKTNLEILRVEYEELEIKNGNTESEKELKNYMKKFHN